MIKRRLDKKAVSPVIATILMVAITVVLSATLYMMISTEDKPEQTKALAGDLKEVQYGWLIEIHSSSGVLYDKDKVQIYNPQTGAVLENVTEFTGDGNPPDIDSDIHVKFRDNDGNGEITQGDTFVIGDQSDYLEDKYKFRIDQTTLSIKF